MSLPPTYTNELNTLNREILKSQPSDVLQFCANFFSKRLESQRAEFLLSLGHTSTKGKGTGSMAEHNFPGSNPFGGNGAGGFGSKQGTATSGMHKLAEEDENDTIASPTASNFRNDVMKGDIPASGAPNSNSPFGGFGGDGTHGSPFGTIPESGDPSQSSDNSSAPPSAFRGQAGSTEGFPSNYSMGRRTSVSAESMNPTTIDDNWSPPFHQKSHDQLTRLKAAVSHNFLFSHLDEEQTSQVLGALVEKPIPAKDIKVIIQGDVGDYFYVVEKGQFDIFVNPAGTLQPGADGLGNKVNTIGQGGSFGELALMYNAPRAATVISTEASTLWALDRITFRRILMDSAFQRRRMYESFLEEVPLLSTLTKYERSKIADALDTQRFPPRSTIIKEGDPGEAFFLLEDGQAEVFKRGIEKPVNSYKKGDYFGELALLNDAPRAASVVSTTDVKVATLGKDGFQRLLGPVEGIMRRNDYNKGVSESVDPLSKGD